MIKYFRFLYCRKKSTSIFLIGRTHIKNLETTRNQSFVCSFSKYKGTVNHLPVYILLHCILHYQSSTTLSFSSSSLSLPSPLPFSNSSSTKHFFFSPFSFTNLSYLLVLILFSPFLLLHIPKPLSFPLTLQLLPSHCSLPPSPNLHLLLKALVPGMKKHYVN